MMRVFGQKIMLVMAIFFNGNVIAQEELKWPDEFLLEEEPAKVLLVGSFHFAYYGLDAHKTAEEDQINVLSDEKQKEIDELVAYIAKFRPTKLVVENWSNTTRLMDAYRAHRNEGKPMRPDEVDQICFRLMDQFGIDTLYGADDESLSSMMEDHKDTAVFHPFLEEMYEDWDFVSDKEMSQRYNDWYAYLDKLSTQISLLDYFKYVNSEQCIRRLHGSYLVGDFELGDKRGADALTLYWYSRNLRIFRNIQQVTEGPEDRILVLFGMGHSSILLQQFESSPEYELVPFTSL